MYGSRNPRPPLPRALAGLLGAVLAAAACWIAKPFGKDRAVQALPEEGTALPAVMYHNVLPDGSGGLGDYVISAPELEGGWYCPACDRVLVLWKRKGTRA